MKTFRLEPLHVVGIGGGPQYSFLVRITAQFFWGCSIGLLVAVSGFRLQYGLLLQVQMHFADGETFGVYGEIAPAQTARRLLRDLSQKQIT